MEYMIEKFGSRAVIYYPQNALLSLHTTYIMMDKCKNSDNLCRQIANKICSSLYKKEKKNFDYFDWKCSVFGYNDNLNFTSVLNKINNKKDIMCNGNDFIQTLITQIPIQIARGVSNSFHLMYNGTNDQTEYTKNDFIDSYNLRKSIRFGGYDGLIKSWNGAIKIVTSMGRQSTGKSYMLNHLFGTKFDISGSRCTDGVWLSVKIINNILYIICDFEGLGSIQRSIQEDMLLATFNAAISNCTLFKCENHFDRSFEEMFHHFQTGVKIMSGSENCFKGELMFVIKDVVDNAADEAEHEFGCHIERIGNESELIFDDKGNKESTFFAYQMYKAGVSFAAFPPLNTDDFFIQLNETIKPAIDQIDIIHNGGKQFLDYIKLIMAKLSIGDFGAMYGEHAKIRAQEIRDNLKNAVETGSIIQPINSDYPTFEVDDDEHLLLLDDTEIINITIKEVIDKIKNYKEIIEDYSLIDEEIEDKLIKIIESLNDYGIILGKAESLEFLWEQFSVKIKRNHNNYKSLTNLFQLFLDLIYWRRKLRVIKYIKGNTIKFNKDDKSEIESLLQSAETQLNSIRGKLKICKSKCEDCFFLCLLCKNHEDENDSKHHCYQANHSCKEICTHCHKFKNGKSLICGNKCGHSGHHDCDQENHSCGKSCTVNNGSCQEKCSLISGHDNSVQCKCSAETHYCQQKCAVPICKNQCKMPYNKHHTEHICIQGSCPYRCQVQCWNHAQQSAAKCNRPCTCNGHSHHLNYFIGEIVLITKSKKHDNNAISLFEKGTIVEIIDNKFILVQSRYNNDIYIKSKLHIVNDKKRIQIPLNENNIHICDIQHSCPQLCKEKGICQVEVHQKIEKKAVFTTGTGSKIEYDKYAECNAKKKPCSMKIAIGKFKHDGNIHKCDKNTVHSCDIRCSSCGYYCEQKYGHFKKGSYDSYHDGQHGNMRNTKFYAVSDVIDIGNNISYRVGDVGKAEHCGIYCQNRGRGHIHLEFCEDGSKDKCTKIPSKGIRHQIHPYKPDIHKEKDEVQHSTYWSRKHWKDPCKKKDIELFKKCPYFCAHPSHELKNNDNDQNDTDNIKYCQSPLWHHQCKLGCNCCHAFQCSHPFSNAHIIFVCDRSGSMNSSDGGKSIPKLQWILNTNNLSNRLGTAYESIHKFVVYREQLKVNDVYSVILFNSKSKIIVNRKKADINFVKNNKLLVHKPKGTTNFHSAFLSAKSIIKDDEDTVIIFLTDGKANDGGSKNIIKDLKNKMKDKFKLFCVTLASKTSTVLKDICIAGKGDEFEVLNGDELGTTFTAIAKTLIQSSSFMNPKSFQKQYQ